MVGLNDGAGLVARLWMGASVITVAVFTAGVTSQLTAKQLQGAIHGFTDLRSVRVGAAADTATLDYLRTRRVDYDTYGNFRDGLKALQSDRLTLCPRPPRPRLTRKERVQRRRSTQL